MRRRARLAVNANESASETRPLECATCRRSFRCQQDINRHRCVTTRPRGQRARPPHHRDDYINSDCHFAAVKHHPQDGFLSSSSSSLSVRALCVCVCVCVCVCASRQQATLRPHRKCCTLRWNCAKCLSY